MIACIVMIVLGALLFIITIGGGIGLCYLSSLIMAKNVFYGGCLLFLALILFIISLLMGVWMARNSLSHKK